MGYMGFPIKLVGLTSGYAVGSLGATHMCLEDIAIMRAMPNIVVLSPADCTSAVKATFAAAKCDGPVYLRLSGGMNNPVVYKSDFEFEIGKAIVLREGSDISLIATGSMVQVALKTADMLAAQGLSVEVVDMHTIKPIDEAAIKKSCAKRLIVTLEEHSHIGGLGSAVAETLALCSERPPHLILGAEYHYPHAAPMSSLHLGQGLVPEVVMEKIIGTLNKEK
jgi:transketolase